ncbi:DUF6907 domain-containing protein [Streptomyces synnematoformans]|uniref:Uncharacterized protein n=1 Tax=Streptomyces synnematoformans TaxID=415721 RepID=A0ABN2Y0B0_9ACTN
MPDQRMITVDTRDHGPVTIPEPAWCAGVHPAGGFRVDITHASGEMPLTFGTECCGPVPVLTVVFESRPYTDRPPGRGVFVNVGFDSDWHPLDPAGLEALADQLTVHAGRLQGAARRLAVLVEEESDQ